MLEKCKAFLQWIWRRKYALLLGGVAFCLAFAILAQTIGSRGYQMRVSYIYPEAKSGVYPDGQRFVREDMVKEERILEALEEMRKKGWYQDIQPAQIKASLSVKEYLTDPVQGKVESMLNQGEQYTYYNSEYILSFTQPIVLHPKDPTDLFGLLRQDRSKEFVEALHRANVRAFLDEHTEGNVFADFGDYLMVDGADYDQIVSLATDRTQLCMNYLRKKQEQNSTFVSRSTGLSFQDLAIAYQSLLDLQIARLDKYAQAQKLSRSIDERVSRYQIDISEQELLQKKKQDEHELAKTAMLEYDHTFSENIIIVSVNEENGLYQARPKTAYDTVTQRSLNAGISANEAANYAQRDRELVQAYQSAMATPGVEQKLSIADGMVEEIKAEYERLNALSVSAIADYLQFTNASYIRTQDTQKPSALAGVAKYGMAFILGAAVSALILALGGHRQARRKRVRQETGR